MKQAWFFKITNSNENSEIRKSYNNNYFRIKISLVSLFCFMFLSCSHDVQKKQDDIEITTACGCEIPQENLAWLKEMITKAESDTTGNYVGTIWLIKYKEQDIFVTNMMLGSGGVANYFFDCSGNHLILQDGESYCPSQFVGNGHFFIEDEKDFEVFFHNTKLDNVVYSPETSK